MKTRLTLHADFGASCPGSKEAADYLRRVLGGLEGAQFERKIMRRAGQREVVVQFSVVLDRELAIREEAETFVDTFHNHALGGLDYENMVIVENGVEVFSPVES